MGRKKRTASQIAKAPRPGGALRDKTSAASVRASLEADVVVFGAGIAGLTVAHELAERNFRVAVIDPNIVPPTERRRGHDHANPGVGGMAKSQWCYFPAASDAKPHARRANRLRETLPRPEWSPALVDYAAPASRARPTFGSVVDGELITKARRSSLEEELDALTKFLVREQDKGNEIPIAFGTKIAGAGARGVSRALEEMIEAAASKQRPRRTRRFLSKTSTSGHLPPNKVEVRLDLVALPGEHGFRFFPSFYRHVFDTLKRIPLSRDVDGSRYRRGTVFDNLVPTEEFGYVSRTTSRSVLVPRRPLHAIEDVRDLINGILEVAGYAPSDVALLGRSFLRYLTSSRLRREREYENVSWFEFVEADRMTTRAQYLQETMPGALLALSGSSADARSQGTIALQLVRDSFAESDRPSADMLLNGPTDLAWFAHWHRHLEKQDVTFHKGELLELGSDGIPRALIDEDGRRVEVEFVARNRAMKGMTRFVVALPMKEAHAIAKKLLAEMTTKNIRRSKARDFAALVSFVGKIDLAKDLKNPTPKGPLRHLSGVQYFFDEEIRLWCGHTQYLDAPYGLSAVSQAQFWRVPEKVSSGFKSILSVDIGIWSTPDTPDGSDKPTEYAWNRSPDFLAKEVWKQIEAQHAGEWSKAWPKLPTPYAYHVDDNLLLDEKGRIVGNRSPFLVNQSGRYRARPGWTGELDAEDRAVLAYDVAFGRYVMAGTHMQTATRVTSMEAACESGRRAVNALLDLLGTHHERCGLWDPEDFEPEALRQLRTLDRDLCQRNRPHVLDILRPLGVTEAWSHR